MALSSRIPGFYRLSIEQRIREISQRAELDFEQLRRTFAEGGLDPERADKVVENVLGVYGLPLGVALNFTLNGRDRLIPMVVEEPSVIAAASNAARMVRNAGGFQTEMVEELMTTQVQLFDVPDADRAETAVQAAREELLELARAAVPKLIERGGGPRSLELRNLGQGVFVIHIHVDCCDAMGANLVNTIAEAVGPRAAELTGGQLGLRILTNLCDRRRVRVTARVRAEDLLTGPASQDPADGSAPQQGQRVIDAIVQASRFAELDPYRAATHNKGIMNGIDSVVIATGNDYRAVEAGAHAYAAQSGRYRPLAVWRREGEQLLGQLEMPLALGVVGGTLRVHPAARLALQLAGVESANDLAQLAAAAGLASNLAAVRALATEGIQRGHMSLHARSVAVAAGATGDEVDFIARQLSAARRIDLEHAQQLLAERRRLHGAG